MNDDWRHIELITPDDLDEAHVRHLVDIHLRLIDPEAREFVTHIYMDDGTPYGEGFLRRTVRYLTQKPDDGPAEC